MSRWGATSTIELPPPDAQGRGMRLVKETCRSFSSHICWKQWPAEEKKDSHVLCLPDPLFFFFFFEIMPIFQCKIMGDEGKGKENKPFYFNARLSGRCSMNISCSQSHLYAQLPSWHYSFHDVLIKMEMSTNRKPRELTWCKCCTKKPTPELSLQKEMKMKNFSNV